MYEGLGGETRPRFELDRDALARHDVDPATARAVADLVLAGGDMGELAVPADAPTAAARPLRVRLSLTAPWLVKQPQDLVRDATVRAGPQRRWDSRCRWRCWGASCGRRCPRRCAPSAASCPVTSTSTSTTAPTSKATSTRARHDVEAAVGPTLQAAAGERLEWTGQYKLLTAGQRRLQIIVPLVALVMLGLLFLQFRSLTEALIVLVSVPFALVGSFWTLYLLDYRLSAPVWVGLLSVVGLAMQTGVVMVVYIDDAFLRRVREGRLRSREDIVAAHAEGTVRRLRPKLMTIATMAAALLPLLWAQGAGSEIMKRVAAPMIGGPRHQRLPDAGGHPGAVHDLANAAARRRARLRPRGARAGAHGRGCAARRPAAGRQQRLSIFARAGAIPRRNAVDRGMTPVHLPWCVVRLGVLRMGR